MELEYRNPVYTANGDIDCEINHPDLGWIPFTASENDTEQYGKDLFAEIVAAGNVGEYVEPDPVVIVPQSVTANQFGKQLIAQDLLDEVTTWVNQQDAATQWSFNRSATFDRNDPMMEAGFTALGFTTQQIDQFFIDAAKL